MNGGFAGVITSIVLNQLLSFGLMMLNYGHCFATKHHLLGLLAASPQFSVKHSILNLS